MTIITAYIDEATAERLRLIAEETGRRCEDLAESAIAEEALRYFRARSDDPGQAAPLPSAAQRRIAREAAL